MSARWKAIAEGLGLVLALGFVFLMAFAPHLATSDRPAAPEQNALVQLAVAGLEAANGTRDVYDFPIHVDEHLHWVYTSALLEQENVILERSPYTGQQLPSQGFFNLRTAVHEQGFRLIVAEIHSVTGIPFLQVFTYLPAIWLTFTAFGMYAALRPHAAAVPTAAFVALIPTTLRFLGPGFLVPIGFVLAWLPAALILAEPAKRFAGGAALLALTVVWAFFVHLVGGFAALGLLVMGGLFGGARNVRSILTLLVITAAPLVWLYQAFTSGVNAELRREESLPIDFTIFDNIGLVGLYVWAIGAAIYGLSRREKKSMAQTAFVTGSLAMMALIILGVSLDWGRYATYARWHPPFFLAAAVPLGYAAASISTATMKWLGRAYRGFALPKALVVAVALLLGTTAVGAISTAGVEKHLKEPYYRVLDSPDIARFQYVNDHVGPDYEVFLMDPWRAPVLVAMSGRVPYAVLYPGSPPVGGGAYDEYVRTGQTLEFFILNDVTLVIATGKPPMPEFIDLGHAGVWGLRPEIAHEIAEIRAQERSSR